MNCAQFTTAPVCYNNGTVNETLTAHYEYGTDASGNAVLHKVRYCRADGTPVDTSAGTVTAGACAITPPDVEQQVLCDVQADGSVIEFVRRTITTFDSTGAATTTVTDWETDYVTPYTPTGTVGACQQDCDAITAQGVVSAW